MKYFNVSLLSLRGKPHPAICDIHTVKDINKMKSHLQMLTCSFLTYKLKSEQYKDISPICRLCRDGEDDIG